MSKNCIKTIIIDSCSGMTDGMLARMLGVLDNKIGASLNRLVISNQQFGKLSAEAL